MFGSGGSREGCQGGSSKGACDSLVAPLPVVNEPPSRLKRLDDLDLEVPKREMSEVYDGGRGEEEGGGSSNDRLGGAVDMSAEFRLEIDPVQVTAIDIANCRAAVN